MGRAADTADPIADRRTNEAKLHPPTTAITRLMTKFCLWKLLLVLVAAASPGPGYDTSTQLLLLRRKTDSWLEHCAVRLTRWDGLYFASASANGQIFEQQWAFSPLLARVTSSFAGVFFATAQPPSIATHALAAIFISHLSHLIAVILLFQLTYRIVPAGHERKASIAYTAACLHVISPAGLFLSAPYGEAAFAMVHFAGLLFYVEAKRLESSASSVSALWTLASGFVIGVSTMIRSNGLLSGLLFLCDALAFVPHIAHMFQQRDRIKLSRLLGTFGAGLFVGVGYALPQVFAYLEYCTNGNDRPWCHRTLPSIYSFVQSHYWGVGFFKYWTLSNAPLFALAVPMLAVFVCTSYDDHAHVQSPEGDLFRHTMARFALPQLLLAFLALTSFHVQIINRISSGYPLWYIVLATIIQGSNGIVTVHGSTAWSGRRHAMSLVRLSVMYAIIQGGLFASFMPPA
ncbi:glycosyltransferase family 76 protein [Cercospora zeae-maydis SCOH1-5]|uniref:GPI mannosyltransferase 2 n=1 Tax=Cercospora zeae-maydis SCOH1-5 TaxID=717836 RepID=A0A6A6FPQ0_9PEZI|nr:glycosyltransferase family 76 protein [Cercospora zeae-maydis SCOH1-5]